MTNPTKRQRQALEHLANCLLDVTTAVRLDGQSAFNSADLREFASRLARASSAFGLDRIVEHALDERARTLGLRAGCAELITLLQDATPPLDFLLLSDDDFRARIETLEIELDEAD